MVGKVINSYKIEKLLGQGGMGSVYKAKHTVLNREAALKLLHFNFSGNPKVLERFKNEALTLDSLKHENIVQLLDYGQYENTPFLLLEFIEGIPLDEYIRTKSGPIPEKKAAELLLQMLEGLNYAHKRTVVHRDIKPANFMLTQEGKIKILDFGIAKILSDNNMNMTSMGQKIGTIPYMSPEQIQAKAIDVRSDIYSLGVTLFQMLTGKEPYKQTMTEWELSNKIVFEPLPKAIMIYPHISEEIQAILDKATAKKKEDRYQNCDEFISDILEFLPDNEKKEKEKQITPPKLSSAQAKKEYTELFETFYEDRVISKAERSQLIKKQAELSLKEEQVKQIEAEIIKKYGKPEDSKKEATPEKKIPQNSEKSKNNKKKIMFAAAAVILIVVIGFAVKALFFAKAEGIDYASTNFEAKYLGKMEHEGNTISMRLNINKVESDWTVYYDFYIGAEQKLTNKQARINTDKNEIMFLLSDASEKEKETILLLNKAGISINSIGKVVFTGENNAWELVQLN